MIKKVKKIKKPKSYYKKKIGRPKKRGPKRKPKKRGREWQETWDYKIVKCDFNKQDRVIGIFHSLDEVELAKTDLINKNNSILLPKTHTIRHTKNKTVSEYKSEYIVLEKIRDNSSDNITKLRNEYGKLVNFTTTNDKWKIVDKFPCLKEELFWVYGCNPRTDRKDFSWILDNLIKEPLEYDNFLIIRIYLYYNKVVFRYDTDDIAFVVCKNEQCAIKLYNTILKHCEKNKRTVFVGRVINKSELGQHMINLIKEKTGWDKNKIIRTTTT